MNFYRQVLYLLQNTYSAQSTELVQNSVDSLIALAENPQFSDILRQIVLHPINPATQTSAILLTRHLSSENLFPLFFEFNEMLDCSFHIKLTILCETLATNYPQELIERLLNTEMPTLEKFNIKTQKSYFMLLSALIQTILPNENDKIELISQIIQQSFAINLAYIQSLFDKQNLSLLSDQIVFIHYFIRTISKLLKMTFIDSPELFSFLHFLSCVSFRIDIDNLIQNLKTAIVPTLIKIYSWYYRSEYVTFDFLKSFFENLCHFVQKKPIDQWPIQMMKNIRLYFEDSPFQHPDLLLFISEHFLLPLFSIDLYHDINDIGQFIEIFSPFPSNASIFSAVLEVFKPLHSDEEKVKVIYAFSYSKFNATRDEKMLVSIIHFMSNCMLHFENELFAPFLNTVIKPLLNISSPPFVLVLMHYLSSMPLIFFNKSVQSDENINSLELDSSIFSPDLLEFVRHGIFEPNQLVKLEELPEFFSLSPESFLLLIQYYSVLTFSHFCNVTEPSFPQQLIHDVLDVTLQIDLSNDGISNSIRLLINSLSELDDQSAFHLIQFSWNRFEVLCQSEDRMTVANYLNCLVSIFEKSTKSEQLGNLILSLIENLLKSSQESETSMYLVSSLVEKYSDEFFSIFSTIFGSFVDLVLSFETNNQLFTRLFQNVQLILSLDMDDSIIDLDFEDLDLLIMKFVNLKELIDFHLLLTFYQLLLSKVLNYGITLNSLKAFHINFSHHPEVESFFESNKEAICQFIESGENEIDDPE